MLEYIGTRKAAQKDGELTKEESESEDQSGGRKARVSGRVVYSRRGLTDHGVTSWPRPLLPMRAWTWWAGQEGGGWLLLKANKQAGWLCLPVLGGGTAPPADGSEQECLDIALAM